MPSIFRQSLTYLACTVLIGLCSGLSLQAEDDAQNPLAAGLIGRSPFLPEGGTPSATPPPTSMASENQGTYEFRGYYAINGDLRFLVKNRQEPDGVWMRLNEMRDDRKVLEFNAQDRSVLFETGGDQMWLPLVTLAGNSTPLAVNGQPAVGSSSPRAANVRPGAVRRQIPGNNGSSDSARRRAPPTRPKWLQDRLDAQEANSSGSSANPSQLLPPGAVNSGQRSNESDAPFDRSKLVLPSGGPPTSLPPTGPPEGIPELPPELQN